MKLKRNVMLKVTRRILATVMFLGITLLFIGLGHRWWGWMAGIQLLPSVFRLVGGAVLGNVLVVAAILCVTAVFGRVYCSVVCPMGIFQDIVIWVRRVFGKKKRYAFHKEHRVLRYSVLVLSVLAAFSGMQALLGLVAPYSAYGRMVRGVVEAVEGNGTAGLLVVAGVTFVVIVLSACFFGREWCNAICPVGTILGLVGRKPLLGIRIDGDKCVSCGKCARECKCSCIDSTSRTVDYSRCVDCFECMDNCGTGAIGYGISSRESPSDGPADDGPSSSRRAFLATGALLGLSAAGLRAQDINEGGGLAPLKPRRDPVRSVRIVPPGASGTKDFYSRCTGCQLCVSACPEKILKVSTDPGHFMQPYMSFTDGYCRPGCTACSQVCPSGAIRPLPSELKGGERIGVASVDTEACIGCANCVSRCPSGALMLVRDSSGGKFVPAVAEEQCTGCGACEHLCPVRPVSAITVNGFEKHIRK